MRAAGEIAPEEFFEKQAKYLEEKKGLEKLFNETGQRVDRWIETGDRMFDFIENAKFKFEKGSPEIKRSILSTLGSDFVLKDKILSLSIEKSLFPLKRVSKSVNEIKKRLKPLNTLEKQREFDNLCEIAEGRRFELLVGFPTHRFQRCALDRYANLPKNI